MVHPGYSGVVDVEHERDALVLIQAGRDILDGQRAFAESGITWSAPLLAQTQQRLALLGRIVARLRVVTAMRLGPAEEQDWAAVERGVETIDRRERQAPGGIPE